MLQKSKRLSFFVIVTVSLLLSSCSESGVIVNQTQHIQEAQWSSSDSLLFKFNVQDTLHYFDFSVLVRNTENYKWSNIYLFSDLTFPNGKTRRDTIEVQLANQYGKWLGHNSGTVVTTSAVFMQHRKFPLSGNYKIVISHGMREPILEEVIDIGVKIKQWVEK